MALVMGLMTEMAAAQMASRMTALCSRPGHAPMTLGAQLAQQVYRMACAEQRLVYGPEPERQSRIAARRQAIAGIKNSLAHLNRALLRGMLTPLETVPLQGFKDALKVMQRLGDRLVSDMRSARTPEAVASVRAQAETEWKTGFDQVDTAVRELLLTIEPVKPPTDVTPVAVALPPPGTRWQTRITNASGASASHEWVALKPGVYREKPVYRRSDGKTIRMFDTETGGWVGVVSRSGETLVSAMPHNGVYLSPLWVGKSWMMLYVYEDARRGKRFPNQVRRMAVTGYEAVTVPAGTYMAFKLEGRSYATRLTVWYAPAINLEVKRISERLQGHYQGSGASMTELIAHTALP